MYKYVADSVTSHVHLQIRNILIGFPDTSISMIVGICKHGL